MFQLALEEVWERRRPRRHAVGTTAGLVLDVDTLLDETTIHGAVPVMPLALGVVEVCFGLVFHFRKLLGCRTQLPFGVGRGLDFHFRRLLRCEPQPPAGR